MSFTYLLRRMIFCPDTAPLTVMLTAGLSLGVYTGYHVLTRSPEVLLDRQRRMDKIGESPKFAELADKYEHSIMRSAAAKLGRGSIFPNKV